MDKLQKGTYGYLNRKKKREILRTILYFAIVAAIFFLGYSQTHTRLNVLTIVAVLGCLPACKSLVGVLTRLPYASVEEAKVREVEQSASHLTWCCDMVMTSEEKVMPLDFLVISGSTICGYTHYEKVDEKKLEKHLAGVLAAGGQGKASIRVMKAYDRYLTRVKALDDLAAQSKKDSRAQEETLRDILLTSSL